MRRIPAVEELTLLEEALSRVLIYFGPLFSSPDDALKADHPPLRFAIGRLSALKKTPVAASLSKPAAAAICCDRVFEVTKGSDCYHQSQAAARGQRLLECLATQIISRPSAAGPYQGLTEAQAISLTRQICSSCSRRRRTSELVLNGDAIHLGQLTLRAGKSGVVLHDELENITLHATAKAL